MTYKSYFLSGNREREGKIMYMNFISGDKIRQFQTMKY